MKIVCISDTHGLHDTLELPKGDMIIHAGDVSTRGKEDEVIDFLHWYSALDFTYKIFIAGNHDFFFENESLEEINAIIPKNIIYLNDSGIEINGLKIWGSPIQPWFYDWAFNRQRGSQIKKHWDLIPEDVDILITHGPAYGILDLTVRNEPAGCEDLLTKIRAVKPKFHISGHIHEGYGSIKLFGINFINASVLNANYHLTNAPIVIEI